MGEFIQGCVERELWEEVGLKARFKTLLYFRELPIVKNRQMDIYFVCLMDYEEAALANISICDREIIEYQWVPLEEYKAFGEKYCSGTQKEVARYIHSLAEKGFRFGH